MGGGGEGALQSAIETFKLASSSTVLATNRSSRWMKTRGRKLRNTLQSEGTNGAEKYNKHTKTICRRERERKRAEKETV